MKNQDNIETVDNKRHGKLKIKLNVDQAQARDQNLVSVVLTELNACASNFAVVFIEVPESENKRIRPVAVLGLRPGENVYYNEAGWDTTYIPLMVQRYPFIVGFDDRVEDPNQLATCLIRNSPMVVEADGIAMFTETGEETDFLKSRHQILGEIFEGERAMDDFMQRVHKYDLLTPLEIILQAKNGEMRKVTGMYTISMQKLKELGPQVTQELIDVEFLPACYLILGSLFQLHRLMQLRNKQNVDGGLDYRIDVGPQTQPPAAA
ncbi:MAG TPA: SapC family protein [Candidatus Acidoferrum sp.]|nr:SapC family protein [Candidatus Acidoferrum sp.]